MEGVYNMNTSMKSTMCSYFYRAGITVESVDDVECSGTTGQYERTGPIKWNR
jgi:hypothetical protein